MFLANVSIRLLQVRFQKNTGHYQVRHIHAALNKNIKISRESIKPFCLTLKTHI